MKIVITARNFSTGDDSAVRLLQARGHEIVDLSEADMGAGTPESAVWEAIGDAEAAITCEGQADLVGSSQLAAQDGGSAEAHGGKAGGMVDGAGNGDVKLLGNAVLVPTHIGEDAGIFGNHGLYIV